MNVNNFNDMTNKEKYEFISKCNMFFVDYLDEGVDILYLKYYDETDALELYSTYTDNDIEINSITYDEENYFKFDTVDYGIVSFKAVKLLDVFDKNGDLINYEER